MTSQRRSPALPREPRTEARARVFLLPYSGCGASMYRGWPTMHEGVNFCPVQLPGRENRMREAPYNTYGELASSLAHALSPYFDRPYALFGHCGSALAAYETAVRLSEGDYSPPVRLFVSSEVAPQDGPYGRFLDMTDEELTAELGSLLSSMGSQPDPELIEITMQVLTHDLGLNKRYHIPHPRRLPIPITTIGWSHDTGIPPQMMSGWAECGEVDSVVLEGGHYAFAGGPTALLGLITRSLQGSEKRG